MPEKQVSGFQACGDFKPEDGAREHHVLSQLASTTLSAN